MNKMLMGVIIWFAYLALSTYVTLYNMVFGGIIAVLILAIMPARSRKTQISTFPGGFKALMRYLWMTAKNTIIGGIQVAAIVLGPKSKLKSGIIAVDPDCDHELGRALSAHAISLSPGELLVETGEDGVMYIHSLNVDQTLEVTRKEQKERQSLLKMMFG